MLGQTGDKKIIFRVLFSLLPPPQALRGEPEGLNMYINEVRSVQRTRTCHYSLLDMGYRNDSRSSRHECAIKVFSKAISECLITHFVKSVRPLFIYGLCTKTRSVAVIRDCRMNPSNL